MSLNVKTVGSQPMHIVKIAITITAKDVAQLAIRWLADDTIGLRDLVTLQDVHPCTAKDRVRGSQLSLMVSDVDGREEKMLYRIVPCGGAKLCPLFGEQCHYIVSTREHRRCPSHSTEDLIRSSTCPVEFVYIRPAEKSDCRTNIQCHVQTDHRLLNDPGCYIKVHSCVVQMMLC